jgi:TetR/AcrR family transcriptional repressor of nem operon
MRYPADRKEKARAALLVAAGRAFRAHGYGGVGVDRLAQDAGVTSGAFYGHFRSKEESFREAVRAAMARLHAGLLRFRDGADADAWLDDLLDWYLGPAHRADLAGGCGLPSLSGEVARADAETQAIYEAGLDEAVRLLAESAPLARHADADARARALLALLAGGVTLSRAVRGGAAAERMAASVRAAARVIIV